MSQSNQPVVENIEAFVSHCERTLANMELARTLKRELHVNDKKLLGFMLRWLMNRCEVYNPNTLPAEYSERLARVMEKILAFSVYRVSGGGRRGISDGQKRIAEEIRSYLTADVPAGTVEAKFKDTSHYINEEVQFKAPGPKDPIWGDYGILRGFAVTTKDGSKKRHKIINPNYEYLKRDAKVFGDNGIEIGSWYPRQLMAVFAGAHDELMSGIAGTDRDGAWSIVVSGHYDDFDQDNGETLFYSGSGSKDNADPDQAKRTKGTLALQRSIETGKPVRVLRSGSSGGGNWCPKSGIRYDGLYRVVSYKQHHNKLGGLFLNFELVREGGQPPLGPLKRIPLPDDIKEYDSALKNIYN